MSGVILDPITSPEAIMANLQRLNEALTALQGGSIAISQIVGYEDLVTETEMSEEVKKLQDEVNKLKIPVGGRYYSSSDKNPKELFGYGTWTLVSSGRVEIGAGTTTDSRNEKKSFSGGQTGGEFQHILSVDQIPSE
ncbi:hypothetical protein NX722_23470 [Endozoicomonas gorgoniicola]|uniref:Baseplate structural protein Gp10 C-terminal domain-containing protein n=1 Tax=Endozoicomonas gorgoniicola TaxID=1234144 RepID=A0ABT3N1L7_9GAMM|nr:hypothetical protein [Endozoicomonas gorgoniicola]MCW7555527.1 hypothetical protein [Endozoicomonas gorgoniicola]